MDKLPRAVVLDGTSEGATKGWETRRGGQPQFGKAFEPTTVAEGRRTAVEISRKAGEAFAKEAQAQFVKMERKIARQAKAKRLAKRIAASAHEDRMTSETLRNLADVHLTIYTTRLLLHGNAEGAQKGWATRRNGDGGVSEAASSHADMASQRARLTDATATDGLTKRTSHLKARSAHRAAAAAAAVAGNRQKASEHRQKAEDHWRSSRGE